MSAASTARELAVALLPPLIQAVPELVGIFRKGVEGNDSPLADEVRRILPEEGASATARREIERRLGTDR